MTDVEVLSTAEKFGELLKDFAVHVDSGKQLSARLKSLQKEINKNSKGKKVRSARDPLVSATPSALQKPVQISDELCLFLGFEKGTLHSRQEVTTVINLYIKENNIQDPQNRKYLNLECNEKGLALKKLLREPDQPVTFFNIQRYLKPHYPISEKDRKLKESSENEEPVKSQSDSTSVVVEPVVKEEVSIPVPDKQDVKESPQETPVVKKKVVRKKTCLLYTSDAADE